MNMFMFMFTSRIAGPDGQRSGLYRHGDERREIEPGIVKAVQQMHDYRPRRSRARDMTAGRLRLSGWPEGGSFLMANPHGAHVVFATPRGSVVPDRVPGTANMPRTACPGRMSTMQSAAVNGFSTASRVHLQMMT